MGGLTISAAPIDEITQPPDLGSSSILWISLRSAKVSSTSSATMPDGASSLRINACPLTPCIDRRRSARNASTPAWDLACSNDLRSSPVSRRR